MVAIRFALAVLFVACLSQASPVIQESPQLNKEARASTGKIVQTTLPKNEANALLRDIERAYDNNPHSDSALVKEIQEIAQDTYPRLLNNVFLNYKAAIYYSDYMLVVEIGRDTILVYGI